jgi:hypothetical protein
LNCPLRQILARREPSGFFECPVERGFGVEATFQPDAKQRKMLGLWVFEQPFDRRDAILVDEIVEIFAKSPVDHR